MPAPGQKTNATLVLSASYTDKGGNNIKALTGNSVASLRSSTISFEGNEKLSGFTPIKYSGMNLVIFPAKDGWFACNKVDLTGVKSINLTSMWQTAPKGSISFEARLDAPDGKLLGKGSMAVPKKGSVAGITTIKFDAVKDGNMHEVYFLYHPQEQFTGGVTSLQFSSK